MFNKQLVGSCLLLALLIISGCNSADESPEVTETNLSGNNINNLLNGGYVAYQGDWIFFVEPNDHDYIYAEMMDGKYKQRLIKHEANSLNVIGNQLFYRNISDGGRLYSASIKGKDIIKLTEEEANLIYAEVSWIYFVDGQQRLWRVKHDGTEQERLTDMSVLHYSVNGGDIYFAEPFGKSIYTLEIESKQLSTLVALPHTIVNARYTDNAIIYMVEDDRSIYQASLDDPVPVPLIENVENLYFVDEEYVYYSGEQMQRFNRETGESEVLEQTDVYYNLQMIPQYFYYMDHPNKKFRKLIQVRME